MLRTGQASAIRREALPIVEAISINDWLPTVMDSLLALLVNLEGLVFLCGQLRFQVRLFLLGASFCRPHRVGQHTSPPLHGSL